MIFRKFCRIFHVYKNKVSCLSDKHITMLTRSRQWLRNIPRVPVNATRYIKPKFQVEKSQGLSRLRIFVPKNWLLM